MCLNDNACTSYSGQCTTSTGYCNCTGTCPDSTPKTNAVYKIDNLHDDSYLKALPWSDFRPGVKQVFLLNVVNGPIIRLLLYVQNASVAYHVHPGLEYIFTILGSQTDRVGPSKVGSFIVNKINSGHNITCQAADGNVVLAIYNLGPVFCGTNQSCIDNAINDNSGWSLTNGLFNTTWLNTLTWTTLSGTTVKESVVLNDGSGSSSRFYYFPTASALPSQNNVDYQYLFVLDGTAKIGSSVLTRGSFVIIYPGSVGNQISTTTSTATILSINVNSAPTYPSSSSSSSTGTSNTTTSTGTSGAAKLSFGFQYVALLLVGLFVAMM